MPCSVDAVAVIEPRACPTAASSEISDELLIEQATGMTRQTSGPPRAVMCERLSGVMRLGEPATEFRVGGLEDAIEALELGLRRLPPQLDVGLEVVVHDRYV